MIRRTTLLLTALLGLAAPTMGCSTHYIINTDVEDTSENRKLITFCEKYRRAVERKDVNSLLKLAAPNYYEDGGNVDAADDLDFAGLKGYLTSKFDEATAIRYEIRYHRVTRRDTTIYIDYTYSASYRIPGSKGEEWRRKVDDNRLEIVPHQDEFLITAGM